MNKPQMNKPNPYNLSDAELARLLAIEEKLLKRKMADGQAWASRNTGPTYGGRRIAEAA